MSAVLAFLTMGSVMFSLAIDEAPEFAFFDRLGELRLVSREKDLYVEKLDGSEKRRLTSTSLVVERDAFFSKGGIYVVYETDESRYYAKGISDIKYRYFLLRLTGKEEADEEVNQRIEIDRFTYKDLKREREKEKAKAEDKE